ncbi:hypothetical protein B0T22DRAFT_491630 [Podospora appendiculata]|uniref:Uncharacterized protein n=1 Tax=Podospora appendiculata TaxID=314037 RepID=A0AAE0XCX4_9PEZI|nr:hypothetical protein B0T22DRAFT_491630 [Podospora appendiculata]
MHSLTAVGLLGLAISASALPSSLNTRQTTLWEGTCSTVTNYCTIATPASVAGLVLNCAYGGGVGPIFPGKNCTATGNYCKSAGGLFAPVQCT